MKQEYPKVLYNAAGTAMLVTSVAQHTAAGQTWHESPGEALAAEMATSEVSIPIATEEASIPDAVVESKMDKFYSAPVALIVGHIAEMKSVEDLRELLVLEQGNPKGSRVRVMRALTTRLQDVHVPTPEVVLQ